MSILASGGITTVLIILIFWWQSRRSPVEVIEEVIDLLEGEHDAPANP